LHRLTEAELVPTKQADQSTLIRRVYLDLIGLPPTPEQAKKFLTDESDDAYEKVVNELLASPQFGEKWASWWLDLARYADTKGYERDGGRNIWMYRDWVIKAFNSDMPYDQFTIEQLAGDMLPNASDEQIIATAFHRNTMNNDEGGTDDEEFRVAALIDRVGTTWEVWQSTTMACVQCHTHPYDPFLHDDFYKSMAFFNNTRDEDTPGEHPNLRSYSEADQKELDAIKKWVHENHGADKAKQVVHFLRTLEPKYHPHDFDQFIDCELIDTKYLGMRNNGSARLKQIDLSGTKSLLINYQTKVEGSTIEIHADKPDGELVASFKISKTLKGRKANHAPLKTLTGKHDLYFSIKNSAATPGQTLCDIEWFAFIDELPVQDKARDSFLKLVNAPVVNTPVMVENTPEQHRDTHVFERGNWLVPEKKVTPDVPASLNTFPEDASRDRLGFAKWVVSKDNPLTSRTIVNRIWEQLFGYGIVETLEDFGTQGAKPTHPELLDWLAVQFVNDYDWSVKRLIKTIVMSATYQQDSRQTNEHYVTDPSNSLLGRGPRVRLSAEQVRDQALAVSGLLSKKMYGKSVMPYQPSGIWNTVYNGESWTESTGEDQFRRSVYTYIKRTSPYPSLIMFDASSREVCMSRRIRTNTPLQALVTLNDSTYVIAARSLADKMIRAAATPDEQIASGYSMILIRTIPEQKLTVLSSLYQEALAKFSKNINAADLLTGQENTKPEQAAMTIVAQALLNLDEVITKE
jgi:hypothetical protein